MADNLPKIVSYSTHHITLVKSWLVQKQTALGKDKSNPLTVDSLLKTIWFSIHHHLTNEVLAIPGQTATVNPYIYVSCIRQFWNTTVVKQTNDVTRLQALVDRKKVVILEAAIRDVLRLDDAEGVDCLPNEEIFAELARMGYEKPSTKLTFYKDFFSSQWKFLIHTLLKSMSTKRTSWNEFSSAMASAVICLSTGRKFIFSKYIFESLGGKGFPGVKTPLFEGMLVVGVIEGEGNAEEQVQDVADDAAAQGADTAAIRDAIQEQSIPSPTPPTPPSQQPQDLPSTSQVQHTPPHSPQPQPQPQPQAHQQAADFPMSLLHEALDACAALARRVEHLECDKAAQALEISKLKRRVKKLEKGNRVKVLKLRRLMKVGTSYRIDTSNDVVMEDASNQGRMIDDLDRDEDKKKKVVIRDPEEESTRITPADTKSKDKGKGIMVEEPKPLKKKQQVEMDEEFARKLHEELNKDIDWGMAIEHVKQKSKEDPAVQRYQVMKKRPQTEAQARKNMIMYLKNVAGFRLDYFKGMSYDDILLIFEAKFNSNMDFLLKTREQMEEEERRAIQSINETPTQKAAKWRKLNEEVKDLNRHLEIMPDEDDDVYTEATPLARKLYVSFLTLLDREDLESLWSLFKERFSISKPDNFFDDFLLTTLGAMFEKPDGQAQVWKSQRIVYGQANVKCWKLLESYGVHIITFLTTQLILLDERKYPLLRFTLDQMLNAVKLRVEEQSEMSLELLRFIRQQHQEGQLE
uniref:Synaptobrevin, longin-like domain protein n=1 Tax=Tanacetum cinerariifolium TaxID=118510 RepID=A0A699GXS1_TANCI|nr:synaptobrevin, longin-like domain protein [Tanacetum cinerariifolium]